LTWRSTKTQRVLPSLHWDHANVRTCISQDGPVIKVGSWVVSKHLLSQKNLHSNIHNLQGSENSHQIYSDL
jgi:hypothetical protein